MRAHPLEVTAPPGKNGIFTATFPTNWTSRRWPSCHFCAQSGMGKTSAATKMLEEYLRIVERVYIVSSTIHLDKGYDHIKELIKKNIKMRTLTLTTQRKILSMRI